MNDKDRNRLTDHELIVPGEHARTIRLNEGAVEALEQQRQLFIERFGREPGPNDPVFFDPDEDEPTEITPERRAELMAQFQEAADAAGLDIDVEATLEQITADRRAIQEEHGHSRKIGRNDPCPCGSGLKFKRCHGLMRVATVAVHTDEGRRSRFDCPNCGKTIRFTNSYPLSFRWKVCPGCRLQWIPTGFGLGPHADDIAGQTNTLEIAARGEPV
jgi:hypothetical protein